MLRSLGILFHVSHTTCGNYFGAFEFSVAWQPHDFDWFKINTDASAIVQGEIVAYGAVV